MAWVHSSHITHLDDAYAIPRMPLPVEPKEIYSTEWKEKGDLG